MKSCLTFTKQNSTTRIVIVNKALFIALGNGAEERHECVTLSNIQLMELLDNSEKAVLRQIYMILIVGE